MKVTNLRKNSVLQTQINLERRYWLKSSAFGSLTYCESAVFLLDKEFEGNLSTYNTFTSINTKGKSQNNGT